MLNLYEPKLCKVPPQYWAHYQLSFSDLMWTYVLTIIIRKCLSMFLESFTSQRFGSHIFLNIKNVGVINTLSNHRLVRSSSNCTCTHWLSNAPKLHSSRVWLWMHLSYEWDSQTMQLSNSVYCTSCPLNFQPIYPCLSCVTYHSLGLTHSRGIIFFQKCM